MEAERPGMHTTPTIDYGIVMQGEITLELDSGSVQLTQGDIVVQRATAHAWRNYADQPCVMAFVLISSSNYS
jgi:quercetin dioxygenase-like cupin family protein